MAHILVIEDEHHLAQGLRFNLEADGHDVTVVADGGTALQTLLDAPGRFDAVSLDVMLPVRDGFEVAEQDLQTRGPGEFLGTRQSGAMRFRFGNILRDHDLMERARNLAIEVIDTDGLPRADEIARRLLGIAVPAATARD